MDYSKFLIIQLRVIVEFFFGTEIYDSAYTHIFEFTARTGRNAVYLCRTIEHPPTDHFPCIGRFISSQIANTGNIDIAGSYSDPVFVVEYHHIVIALGRIFGDDCHFPVGDITHCHRRFFRNQCGGCGSIDLYLSFQQGGCTTEIVGEVPEQDGSTSRMVSQLNRFLYIVFLSE